MSTVAESPTVIDVRTIAAAQRHMAVFGGFEQLPIGQSLELRSDHDPVPLKRQFMERFAGQFNWEPLEQGPAQWRTRIERLKEAGGSCCGCCGGGGAKG